MLQTIRSYLQLYTTIDVKKLSEFAESDGGEGQMRTNLMAIKHKSRSIACDTSGPTKSVIDGSWTSSQDIDFTVDGAMVKVSDRKVAKRYSEDFINHIRRTENVITKLNA